MAIDRPLLMSLVAALAIHGAILAVAAGNAVRELVRDHSIPVDVAFEAPSEPVVVDPVEEEAPAEERVVRRHVPREVAADIVRDEDEEREDEEDEGAVLDFFEAEESTVEFRGGVSAGTQTEGMGMGSGVQGTPVDEPEEEAPAASRARPVSLDAREWDCAWPDEADDLGIHRQMVTLRAVVDASGRARRVTVLSDPGYGFGEAARRCAETARFSPALDDAGEPHAATSPPIRVRFTR